MPRWPKHTKRTLENARVFIKGVHSSKLMAEIRATEWNETANKLDSMWHRAVAWAWAERAEQG